MFCTSVILALLDTELFKLVTLPSNVPTLEANDEVLPTTMFCTSVILALLVTELLKLVKLPSKVPTLVANDEVLPATIKLTSPIVTDAVLVAVANEAMIDST